MTEASNPIRASMEIIWHLTCGECSFYWTYPTMNVHESIDARPMHCPLCGAKSPVKTEASPESPA